MSAPHTPESVKAALSREIDRVTVDWDSHEIPPPDPIDVVWPTVGPMAERLFRIDSVIAHSARTGIEQPGDAYLQALQDVLSDLAGLHHVSTGTPAELIALAQSVVASRGCDRLDADTNRGDKAS